MIDPQEYERRTEILDECRKHAQFLYGAASVEMWLASTCDGAFEGKTALEMIQSGQGAEVVRLLSAKVSYFEKLSKEPNPA